MIRITDRLLKDTAQNAVNSPRKRANFNIHASLDDKVHRFLNAMEPDTYVRPHRHSQEGRFELFLCLKGKGAVILFDDSGNQEEAAVLSRSGETVGVEVPPGKWHSILSLESGTVFFEVKEGPYIPISDNDFAPWAPLPDSMDSMEYLKKLKEKLFQSRS